MARDKKTNEGRGGFEREEGGLTFNNPIRRTLPTVSKSSQMISCTVSFSAGPLPAD